MVAVFFDLLGFGFREAIVHLILREMTVAFSTESRPINITLGLPSQRGGEEEPVEGWGGVCEEGDR